MVFTAMDENPKRKGKHSRPDENLMATGRNTKVSAIAR